jgi:hypothetical protein
MGKLTISTGPWLQVRKVLVITRGYQVICPLQISTHIVIVTYIYILLHIYITIYIAINLNCIQKKRCEISCYISNFLDHSLKIAAFPGETERGGTAFPRIWEHPVHLPQAQGRSKRVLVKHAMKNGTRDWNGSFCNMYIYIYLI